MKTFILPLAVAFLVAGLVISPVLAAPLSSNLASGICGDTYTVQSSDYLSKIANTCEITLADLLSLNPQVTDPNVIYAGEELRLSTNVPQIYRSSVNPYYNPYSNTAYSGNAKVTVSSVRAVAGDDISVTASGFPAYAQVDYRVGLQGDSPSLYYDGVIAADGTASQTITIPGDAVIGEYWVVQVITTSIKDAVSVVSHTVYIGATNMYTTYTGYARVSLSRTQAVIGGLVTVTVSGFPANSEIDYRVEKQGKAYSAVYDGTIDTNGNASQTITIPSSAAAGEYWVVLVTTTSLRSGVTVTSHTIYITN